MVQHYTDIAENSESQTTQVGITVGLADSAFIPRNENRTSLVISSLNGANLFLCWNGPAAANVGIMLASGAAPLVLSLAIHGAIVRGPIRAVNDSASLVCYYVETTLTCPCIRK